MKNNISWYLLGYIFLSIVIYSLGLSCNKSKSENNLSNSNISEFFHKNNISNKYQLMFVINKNECSYCYNAFFMLKSILGGDKLQNALFIFENLSEKEIGPVMNELIGFVKIKGKLFSNNKLYKSIMSIDSLSRMLIIKNDSIVFNKPIKHLNKADYSKIVNYSTSIVSIDSFNITTDYLAKTGFPILPVVSKSEILYVYNKQDKSIVRAYCNKKNKHLLSKSLDDLHISIDTLLQNPDIDSTILNYYHYSLKHKNQIEKQAYKTIVNKFVIKDDLLFVDLSQSIILPSSNDSVNWGNCNKYIYKINYFMVVDSLLNLVKLIKIPSFVGGDSSLQPTFINLKIVEDSNIIFETLAKSNNNKFVKYGIDFSHSKLKFKNFVNIKYPSFFNLYSNGVHHSLDLQLINTNFKPFHFYAFSAIPFLYDMQGISYKLPFLSIDTTNFNPNSVDEQLVNIWPTLDNGIWIESLDKINKVYNLYLVDQRNLNLVYSKISFPITNKIICSFYKNKFYAYVNKSGDIWIYKISI